MTLKLYWAQFKNHHDDKERLAPAKQHIDGQR